MIYCFFLADAIPSTELRKRRVHRILTSSIPQYFALITRTRQDLVLIGPEGCTLTSSVDPQVKVSFPRGALQKKIRVGLQVQTVNPRLVEACLGSPRIAISPIVTIEPRRRKFHRPIVVFIPLPNVPGQKSHAPDLSTVRLLCSIAGGTSPAVWEDITGSSPFSLQNGCVSFTTTVSARYAFPQITNENLPHIGIGLIPPRSIKNNCSRIFYRVVGIPTRTFGRIKLSYSVW